MNETLRQVTIPPEVKAQIGIQFDAQRESAKVLRKQAKLIAKENYKLDKRNKSIDAAAEKHVPSPSAPPDNRNILYSRVIHMTATASTLANPLSGAVPAYYLTFDQAFPGSNIQDFLGIKLQFPAPNPKNTPDHAEPIGRALPAPVERLIAFEGRGESPERIPVMDLQAGELTSLFPDISPNMKEGETLTADQIKSIEARFIKVGLGDKIKVNKDGKISKTVPYVGNRPGSGYAAVSTSVDVFDDKGAFFGTYEYTIAASSVKSIVNGEDYVRPSNTDNPLVIAYMGVPAPDRYLAMSALQIPKKDQIRYGQLVGRSIVFALLPRGEVLYPSIEYTSDTKLKELALSLVDTKRIIGPYIPKDEGSLPGRIFRLKNNPDVAAIRPPARGEWNPALAAAPQLNETLQMTLENDGEKAIAIDGTAIVITYPFMSQKYWDKNEERLQRSIKLLIKSAPDPEAMKKQLTMPPDVTIKRTAIITKFISQEEISKLLTKKVRELASIATTQTYLQEDGSEIKVSMRGKNPQIQLKFATKDSNIWLRDAFPNGSKVINPKSKARIDVDNGEGTIYRFYNKDTNVVTVYTIISPESEAWSPTRTAWILNALDAAMGKNDVDRWDDDLFKKLSGKCGSYLGTPPFATAAENFLSELAVCDK